MPSKPKLNDLQLILLSHAAKTDAGNLFPLPSSIEAETASKEANTLVRRALLTEVATTSTAASWRSEDNIHFGLIITEAGKAAIGVGDDGADEVSEEGAGADGAAAAAEQATQAERRPRENSKIANVLALLRRSEGVTLAGLVEATGWQSHTVRAAMTGLRKRGFELQRRKDGEQTVWFISEASE